MASIPEQKTVEGYSFFDSIVKLWTRPLALWNHEKQVDIT
jgi:hypothetical protein